MTVAIPPDIEAAIRTRAEQRRTSMDEIIREALAWYISMPAEALDELSAWQEIRDEAVEMRVSDLKAQVRRALTVGEQQ